MLHVKSCVVDGAWLHVCMLHVACLHAACCMFECQMLLCFFCTRTTCAHLSSNGSAGLHTTASTAGVLIATISRLNFSIAASCLCRNCTHGIGDCRTFHAAMDAAGNRHAARIARRMPMRRLRHVRWSAEPLAVMASLLRARGTQRDVPLRWAEL